MHHLLNSKSANEIVQSPEYVSFRSTIPQKKIVVDDDPRKVWTMYDAGPKHIKCPLICLPPASGTADCFFRQIMALTSRGYRVISLQYPVYWTMIEWVVGFRKLLDHLNLDKVHIFGSSLGGFLAQKFVELTTSSPRVHSLILCNSFSDTSIFNYTDSAVLFWMMPSLVLKRMVMSNYTKGNLPPEIANSVDFMVDQLDSLTQPELASRLTLNCMNCYVEPQKLSDIPMTIISVFDESALSQSVCEGLFKLYPSAKKAHLKKGGNFPYISQSAEVNMYIQVHLRQFQFTKFSACECDTISLSSSDVSPTSGSPLDDIQTFENML
ncbi:maspardin-like isoform X1 [Tachypleus tridentatus]|uniref:maspardin-like isoform X1 n=1 Tax=Tachypleus tridentatus TaxID=6853 RepID=UPI003FD2610D